MKLTNFKLKSFTNLKSSEKRSLLKGIIEAYNVPEEFRSTLAISSMKKVTYKTDKSKKGVIYADDEQVPLYFLPCDYQTPIPTIYTLWKNPTLLPIVLTNSYVVKIIGGGANLMIPGTIPPFDSRCTENAIVGVADCNNPLVVIAVGKCATDLVNYNNVEGKNGVAVTILHNFKDKLTEISKKAPEIPMQENLENLIISLRITNNNDRDSISEDTVQVSGRTDMTQADTLKLGNHEILSENTQKNSEIITDIMNDKEINSLRETDTNIISSKEIDEPNENNAPETIITLSTNDVEYFFKRALLMTLYLEEVKVPVIATTFVSNYLLKNLPIVPEEFESQLNFKKTSWKKSSKFFREMEKLKYLKTKGKDESLTVIELANKSNNLEIANFVAHKIRKANTGKKNTTTQPEREKVSKNQKKISIVKLYKPHNKMKPLFDFCNENFIDRYFELKQISNLLNKYITGRDLVDRRNKRLIELDPFLQASLQESRDKLSRDNKLLDAFLSKDNFTQFYTVLRNDTPIIKSPMQGQPPKIKIQSVYKMGRKVITTITGFDVFGIVTAEELAKYLKVKCSGSTSLGISKQNPKFAEVMVQGPHILTVYKYFVDQGFPAGYIETTDKTKK